MCAKNLFVASVCIVLCSVAFLQSSAKSEESFQEGSVHIPKKLKTLQEAEPAPEVRPIAAVPLGQQEEQDNTQRVRRIQDINLTTPLLVIQGEGGVIDDEAATILARRLKDNAHISLFCLSGCKLSDEGAGSF